MTIMTQTSTQIYQVFIKATPEKIWEALTTPEFTAKYFYGAKVDSTLEAGSRMDWHSSEGDHMMAGGTITEVDPPRHLQLSWNATWDPEMAAEEPSRVTYEIEEQEGGISLLTVTHDKLERSPKTAESVAGGWMMILSGLKTLLETGRPMVDG
jgi:uncharacterized protein YndB with AHSA1/START domain